MEEMGKNLFASNGTINACSRSSWCRQKLDIRGKNNWKCPLSQEHQSCNEMTCNMRNMRGFRSMGEVDRASAWSQKLLDKQAHKCHSAKSIMQTFHLTHTEHCWNAIHPMGSRVLWLMGAHQTWCPRHCLLPPPPQPAPPLYHLYKSTVIQIKRQISGRVCK